jgi:hypothetical protein
MKLTQLAGFCTTPHQLWVALPASCSSIVCKGAEQQQSPRVQISRQSVTADARL